MSTRILAQKSALAIMFASTAINVASANDDVDDLVPGLFVGQFQIASDYVLRGVSQTSSSPQVQGSLTYILPAGNIGDAYAGIWASNISMFTAGIAGNETSSDNENSIELDPFVGLAGAIGNTGFGYDVGYVQFTFPGAPGDFDFAELYLNLSYSIEDLTTTTRAYWSDDYFGKDFLGEENSLAIEQELRYKTPWNLTATATVGEQMIDIPGEQRAIFGADNGDYLYWGVGLETELKDLTWHIRYWDTDTDDALVAACFKAEECDGRVTLGVTKNF